MDERIFGVKIGAPIPTWDAAHRLPISGYVGPECRDSATIYRINSTFMDVAEQPHMMRQWLAGGVITSLLMSATSFVFLVYVLMKSKGVFFDGGLLFLTIELSFSALGFGYVGIRFGRDELFSLARRPIRFNRYEKKIYAVRHRRFFCSKNEGDVTWEIPWNDEPFFCIHRGAIGSEHNDTYHIRCYQVDEAGMVVRGFAIGREWKYLDGLNDLLSQWNYWCLYMNEGPAMLPKPLLFLADSESVFESFLYCMYEVGFGVSAQARIIFFPFFCWMTILRVLALSTCRAPRWPDKIDKISKVAKNDPYLQPIGATPVGWAETSQAHQKNAYPTAPRVRTPGWIGECDGLENAKLWKEEVAPGN